MVWIWDAAHRSLEPQPSHYNITWTDLALTNTPIFLESIPDLHRHNSVRVDPYAHSQHINIKVLKYFNIYIQYGFEMQAMGFGASTITLQHHLGSVPQYS
jgi:hypothetical protein